MSDGDMVEAVARELEAALSKAERENRTFACGYNLIRAAIKALRSPAIESREGWQPIETAPKDGTRILVWATTRPPHYENQTYIETILGGEHVERVQPACWLEDIGEWDLHYIGTPLFWQPLPEPPAIRAGQGEGERG